MKLSTPDIKKLHAILTTCALGDIDAIIIEGGAVRGVNASRTCALISTHEVPSFGQQKLGLSRISSLRSRMDLFMMGDDVNMEAKETDRGEISQLELIQKRHKVQFRCTATSLIKAPKGINDEPMFLVKIGKDQLQLLLNAIRVMSAKNVALIVRNNNTVSAVASDANNDDFTIVFDEPAEVLGEATDSVIHYYSSDIFVSIIKAAADGADVAFSVGVNGTITAVVNGYQISVLSQIGDSE